MNYTKSNNTYFAKPKDDPKDRIEVEIGDSKEPDIVLPQQKISRWDNESNVSLRLLDFDEYSVIQDKDKVIFGNEKQEVHIYPITEGEGGQEFEIILHEKPASNVIEFSLVDKGVEYFYQPELTQEEIKKGAIRPENVVGSYAIYAKTPKTNWVGGKEYKCGKVGHIFRPKIIDSSGTEVWGDLHIENGILSVTIPQSFLDKAVYPIKHAAGLTLGYTTQATTGNSGLGPNIMVGCAYNSTASASGTVDSITAWVASSLSASMKVIMVENSGMTILSNGVAPAVSVPSTAAWTTGTYSSKPSVSNGTAYVECIIVNQNLSYCVWDTGSTGDRLYDSSNSYSTPTNPTDADRTSNRRYSIYATYTAGGSSIKTVNGLAYASVKTVNGLAIASVKTWNGLA